MTIRSQLIKNGSEKFTKNRFYKKKRIEKRKHSIIFPFYLMGRLVQLKNLTLEIHI